MSNDLSDDDMHLYMSQSLQSDVEFEYKRPEAETARATSYSRARLLSTDSSVSDIDLDQKSKRRLTALDKKETWSLEKKTKVRKVLDKIFMSSDEEGADGGLISHPPSWESDTVQKVKEILDNKYLDICSTRSKRLLLKSTQGVKKDKDTPDVPEVSKWILQA